MEQNISLILTTVLVHSFWSKSVNLKSLILIKLDQNVAKMILLVLPHTLLLILYDKNKSRDVISRDLAARDIGPPIKDLGNLSFVQTDFSAKQYKLRKNV